MPRLVYNIYIYFRRMCTNWGYSCPLGPSHTLFLFSHPPLAVAVKLQPGPMMNVAASDCKWRHLKSESPVLTSERVMTESFNHLNLLKSWCLQVSAPAAFNAFDPTVSTLNVEEVKLSVLQLYTHGTKRNNRVH